MITHLTLTRAHTQYQWPAALWQPEEETSWGMFDQSQTAAQAGEVMHSSDTSPVPPGAHAPPQHTTRFTTNVGTCLRGSGTQHACMRMCVCVLGVWLSGLVKNSCGEAEDLSLNRSEATQTEEKVGTNIAMNINIHKNPCLQSDIFQIYVQQIFFSFWLFFFSSIHENDLHEKTQRCSVVPQKVK